MIKREGFDASYLDSSRGEAQMTQKYTPNTPNPQNYSFSFMYQNPYLPYHPAPLWTYDHTYHAYAQLHHNFPHHTSNFLPLIPTPNQQTQNNNNKGLPQVKTRQDDEQQKSIKMEASEENAKDIMAMIIPTKNTSRIKNKKAKKCRKQKFTSYYWSMQENRRYMEFLINQPGLFSLSISMKKNLRVNVMMSRKVKTRSPQQCHSHHQKMIKKHGSIEQVIAYLQHEREQLANRRKIMEKDQVKMQDKNQDNIIKA